MRSFRLKNQTSNDVAVATLQVSKAQRLRLMKKNYLSNIFLVTEMFLPEKNEKVTNGYISKELFEKNNALFHQ